MEATTLIKHEDKKALCCPSGVTFANRQAVRKRGFLSGHCSLRDEKEQSGLKAQGPPGGRADGISTVGMAESDSDEERRRLQ